MLYTVPDLLMTRDRQTQSRVAIIDGDTRLSYAELADRAAPHGALLHSLKTAPGDRVAVLVPRSIETAAAFFGAQLAGAVAVFISDRLRPHQVARIVADAEVSAVLTTARLRPVLRESSITPDPVHDARRPSGRDSGLGLAPRIRNE